MMRFALPLVLLMTFPLTSWAQTDRRLQTITYDPKAVVVIGGCLNFQTMISLASDEQVQNIGVGDSQAWQVTPNKRGNLVFVKPLNHRAHTNMTMVSDKRSYNFELRNAPDSECKLGHVVYDLRFVYPVAPPAGSGVSPGNLPPDPNANLPRPEKRNSAYTYSGAVDLVPIRLFDDGTSTYMKWAAGILAPAVYAINTDNTESLINYTSRGDYFIVEQVAKGFLLRRGDEKAMIYNDLYSVQGLDSLSPKPHGKGSSRP